MTLLIGLLVIFVLVAVLGFGQVTRVSPPAKIEPGSLEAALVGGDLSKFTPNQCVAYYHKVCDSLGLNPYTKPFAYLILGGKKVLYALRDCCDQLRKLHRISIEILSQEERDGILYVRVRAKLPDGRQDEDFGAVPIANLKGEMKSNALLKCVTKAKRRVTLSVCGLGWLDENEVDSIKGAKTAPANEIIDALAEPAKDLPSGTEELRRLLQQAGVTWEQWRQPLGLSDKIEELSEGEAAHVAEMLRVRIESKKDTGGVK